MPPEKIAELEKKIDAVYESVEKTRSYMMWSLIITIAFFVLPAIALFLVVPSFLSTYTSTLSDVNLEGL